MENPANPQSETTLPPESVSTSVPTPEPTPVAAPPETPAPVVATSEAPKSEPVVTPPAATSTSAPTSDKPAAKMSAVMMLVFVLLLATVTGIFAYYMGMQQGKSISPQVKASPAPVMPDDGNAVVCTMDAKVCPDGSAVGRSGPNCEFAACPGETESASMSAALNSYTNTIYKYKISYPSNWEVTTSDNYPASPTSSSVYISNPADKQEAEFFSGMAIEYQGMLRNLDNYEKVDLFNSLVYKQQTNHGEVYFVNIPDTDSFLSIGGAGGHTSNSETNEALKKMFQSFTFEI